MKILPNKPKYIDDLEESLSYVRHEIKHGRYPYHTYSYGNYCFEFILNRTIVSITNYQFSKGIVITKQELMNMRINQIYSKFKFDEN